MSSDSIKADLELDEDSQLAEILDKKRKHESFNTDASTDDESRGSRKRRKLWRYTSGNILELKGFTDQHIKDVLEGIHDPNGLCQKLAKGASATLLQKDCVRIHPNEEERIALGKQYRDEYNNREHTKWLKEKNKQEKKERASNYKGEVTEEDAKRKKELAKGRREWGTMMKKKFPSLYKELMESKYGNFGRRTKKNGKSKGTDGDIKDPKDAEFIKHREVQSKEDNKEEEEGSTGSTDDSESSEPTITQAQPVNDRKFTKQ